MTYLDAGSTLVKPQPLSIQVYGKSDIGRIRTQNEDRFLLDTDNSVFIVSDGIGGHQAGEIAAEAVIELFPKLLLRRSQHLKELADEAIGTNLREMTVYLSRQLSKAGSEQIGLKGMGATLVMAWILETRCFIVNMGDSRAYLFRQDRLQQISEDHSVVALMLKYGEITPDQVKDHPAHGKLSRYVGMEDEVFPDISTITLQSGDRLLLCTDGLTDMLPDDQITSLLSANRYVRSACRALVGGAKAAGGKDNVTVLLMDLT